MPWSEFSALVSGLMADTPLGQIVSIRAEKDPKTIKTFNPDQRRIHREWRDHEAKRRLDNPEALDRAMDDLARTLATMFGGGQNQ